MNPKTHAILEAPVLPTLMRLAAPNIFLAFMQAMVSLGDTWFISQTGTSGLAGIALVFPLIMLMQMLSAGAIGGGVSSAISRALGSGNIEKAQMLAMHAVLIALAFGLLLTGVMLAIGPGLYVLLGGKGAALDSAIAYSSIVFGGGSAVWLCNILANIFRGTGNMMVPATVLSILAAIQIPLCGSLVMGWGPFPQMGIVGAAISYVCCFGAAALYFAFHIQTGRSGLHLPWRKLKLNVSLFRDILGVGLLSSVNAVQTIVTAVIVTGLVGSFGTAAIAGFGLGVRLELLQIPIIFAIGSALVPMVGTNIGAGNGQRARRIAWMGAGLAAVITGCVGLTVTLWPGLWAGLFSNDPGVLHAAYTYLRIVGPFYMFLGIGIALYFASQGAGRVILPMLAGTARFIIAAVGGLLCVRYLEGGLISLFALIGLGMFVLGIACAAAVKFRHWQ